MHRQELSDQEWARTPRVMNWSLDRERDVLERRSRPLQEAASAWLILAIKSPNRSPWMTIWFLACS